jgi:hypothetical protein
MGIVSLRFLPTLRKFPFKEVIRSHLDQCTVQYTFVACLTIAAFICSRYWRQRRKWSGSRHRRGEL